MRCQPLNVERNRRAIKPEIHSVEAAILQGLTRAPVKKLMVVDGGSNPVGDECAAQHWHGFIGMEQEAIGQITAWIQSPKP